MSSVIKPFASQIEFSSFGKNTLAYVRRVEVDELAENVASEAGLPLNEDLWGLFGADGEPIALSDEIGSLLQSAEDSDLVAMKRH